MGGKAAMLQYANGRTSHRRHIGRGLPMWQLCGLLRSGLLKRERRTRSLEKRSSCSEKRSQKLGEAIAKLGEAIRDEGRRGEATATTSDSHNSDDEKLVEPIATKLGEAMTRSDQQRSDLERAI